jgi:hypothetical protein
MDLDAMIPVVGPYTGIWSEALMDQFNLITPNFAFLIFGCVPTYQ